MSQETIPIPRIIEGREFYDGDSNNGLWRALEACKKAKHDALFMPEIADVKINSQKDARIWQNWYSSPSVRATGRTKKGPEGANVVVYGHIPNYFSNPENIRKAVYSKNLINGAGLMSDKEFQRLLKLQDDTNVFIVDYEKLKKSASGVISVDDALGHPQTIPFLGGQERAERYLPRHKEVFGNKIGVGYYNDLSDKGPLGRLLFVGYASYYDYISLLGDLNLNLSGRFVGVPVSAGGAAPKILSQRLMKF